MRYVEGRLLAGERVVCRAGLHPIIFVPGVILALFGVLVHAEAGSGSVIIGLAALFLISAALRYKNSEFAVTTRRVIIKTGWLPRKAMELPLGKVESLSVDQPVFGRIFNYGTLNLGGTGGTKENFKRIGDPMKFQKRLEEQIESVTAGRRRGTHAFGDWYRQRLEPAAWPHSESEVLDVESPRMVVGGDR